MLSGKKRTLLMYRRTADRLFFATLIFGILLLVIWASPMLVGVVFISETIEAVIFISAVVVLTLSIFTFAARFKAYVQVKSSYFCIVTPLIHLNISYKRLHSAHPAHIQQLFPLKESNWAQRSFLQPFYGKTAIVVELSSYPLNPLLLRLFFTKEMFSPRNTGFILLVPDWLAFSTELDTLHGRWLGCQNDMLKPPGSL